jgi:dipeptide transport system substrate-binding protein
MAMDFRSILSKEYFDTMMKNGTPNAADAYPIGTGPFEFVSYQKDATIRYKAFDKYWGGRPKIDSLIYSITRDATARYAKLKTGECEVMAFPKPADLAEMQKDPQISVLQKEGLNIGHRVQRREETVRRQACGRR